MFCFAVTKKQLSLYDMYFPEVDAIQPDGIQKQAVSW